ncbi:MAG TPA: class I SAM-dependent methyltransferase [Acidobacteriaceae bacterium]|nr:class I SAM-dependent methyltransferase [Acidobacteriaceae bacterium]
MEGTPSRSRVQKPSRETAEARRLVMRFVDILPLGGDVLQVAAGPGSLAIPLARTGRMRVTVLYPSGSAIDVARRNAEKAGVRIDLQHGNPAHMPFPDGSFDFVVCRAPMKSFADPLGVLREMRRVLKPGRRGVILNLRRDIPRDQVTRHVESLSSSFLGQLFARLDFRLELRRAYTLRQFETLLSQVPFGSTRIDGTPMGVEVWFER